jgi:hypothetical protein
VIKRNLLFFFQGIDNKFNVTGEVAGLMAMKANTSEDLHEEFKKVPQKLNIPVKVGVVTDRAPSMAEKNSVSSHIKEDVKNTTGCDLFMYHCLIHKENLCAKSVDITNISSCKTRLTILVQKD